ncbi:VPS9 domain protein [Metarhizium anisopliae]
MSSQNSKGSDAIRQGVPRMPSYPDSAHRNENDRLELPKRAHTFHNGSIPEVQPNHDGPDAFDTAEHSENDDVTETARASVELDELPIELITLTDSFIESLSAKVHSTPPNIEKLSRLFQDFYALASSHIATHLSALATKQSRDISPAPSGSSISSAASRLRSKAASLGTKDKPKVETERQMITAEELANRKRARKVLEAKRGTLEEAVERRLCEGIYNKIYRHRTTQDEAQDEKLRSKTAALALVGITPVDLGVDYGEEAAQSPEMAAKVTEQMRHSLGEARADMVRMSEARYPLAKTNHLKAAHKSIVDTLAEVHPSASADEIMPMLIYTLITLPPENLHIISDLHFIQYFRWEQKLTGEAAYCLTNLEAAISFLQTVDLSTLRDDELPSGPVKPDSHVGTPKTETFPPAYGITAPSQSATEASTDNVTASKPAPSPSGLKAANVLRNRRLSDLVNTPAQAFGAASGAVFNTADQGLKTISNSLGDSYSFLLGKLRERQESPKESIIVPRTLDDARKLVSTPPPDEDDNASTTSSVAGGSEDTEQPKRPSAREDRVLSLISGRRDASVDSVRSGHSSTKKPGFSEDSRASNTPTSATPTAPAMLDSVRNLGSSLNPIGRLSSIGMIRGFGRNTATPSAKDSTESGELATQQASPEIAAALPPKQITVPRIPPPNKRFMEIQGPGELRLGEVRELLKDYRRLAGVLKNIGAFDEK